MRKKLPETRVILGLATGLALSTGVLLVSFFTVYSLSIAVTLLSGTAAIATLSGLVVALYDRNFIEESKDDNETWNELRKEAEEAEDQITRHRRMTRILDSREVNPYTLLQNQTDSAYYLLLNFTQQSGPPLDSIAPEEKDEPEEMPDSEGEKNLSEDTEEDDPDTRFIRRAIVKNYEAVAVSAFTWIIPPWVVAEEGLEDATKGDLDDWVQENIYDRYDDEYEAFVPLVALVDLARSTSRTDVEGKFGSAAEKIIATSDTFTEQQYLDAIAEEGINLLDVVKSGELIYFLPPEVDADTVDRFKDGDLQDEIMESLAGTGLTALADEDNYDNLVAAIEGAGFEQEEWLAGKIQREAKNWSDVISDSI